MEFIVFVGLMTILAIVMGIGYHSGFPGIILAVVGVIYSFIRWDAIRTSNWHFLFFAYYIIFILGIAIRAFNDATKPQAWGA